MSEDIKNLVEEGQKALAALNDAATDMRKDADVLIEAKFEKANAEFDAKYEAVQAELKSAKERGEAMEARLARLNEQADTKGDNGNGWEAKHRAAFFGYVRKGDEQGLDALIAETPELKTLTASNDPQAGYLLAPETVDAEVTRVITEYSPVRQFASVQTIGSEAWVKNVNAGGSAASWEESDTDASSENTNQSYQRVRIQAQAARAVYHASPNLLDDARVNIEQEFANEMGIALADLENAAFVNGTGVNRPRGFLSYTNTLSSSYSGAWESVEYHKTGASGAFKAAGSGPEEVFIDCIHSLKAPYKANARFFLSRNTLGEVRKIKDGDNRPLFMWDGTMPATIAGEPYEIFQDMPEIAADSYSIAYGDLRAAYQVVDRAGLTVLRDPYSSKPQVEFFGRKRVGGGMKMFEALKLIRFEA